MLNVLRYSGQVSKLCPANKNENRSIIHRPHHCCLLRIYNTKSRYHLQIKKILIISWHCDSELCGIVDIVFHEMAMGARRHDT